MDGQSESNFFALCRPAARAADLAFDEEFDEEFVTTSCFHFQSACGVVDHCSRPFNGAAVGRGSPPAPCPPCSRRRQALSLSYSMGEQGQVCPLCVSGLAHKPIKAHTPGGIPNADL